MFNPEKNAADIDLTYEYVRDTPFARRMEVLYELAFHGRLDASAEEIDHGGTYTWIAALLMDARESHCAEEWHFHGADVFSHADNCLLVAELANARHILEGGEGFSHFSRRGKKERNDLDCLTVGQLALLANMEEMSIRAAANPKRANPLKTYNEEGRTRITREDAKTWLKTKGCYIPVTRYWSAGEVDLQKRRFQHPFDLYKALEQRRRALLTRLETNTLDPALLAAGVQLSKDHNGEQALSEWQIMPRFDDAAFMTTLAELLDLPAPWLVLRAREVATLASLADVERELKALSQPPENGQD